MKRLHNMAAFGLAAVLTASVPFQALAGSPEFAYTPEKWSALRDNKLEYGEIADLVHEYNPTVLNNQASYEQNREGDMGRSDGDIAASYRHGNDHDSIQPDWFFWTSVACRCVYQYAVPAGIFDVSWYGSKQWYSLCGYGQPVPDGDGY